MNILNPSGKTCCPKMVKASLPMKSASSNARFRKRPTMPLMPPTIPLVPMPKEHPDYIHVHRYISDYFHKY